METTYCEILKKDPNVIVGLKQEIIIIETGKMSVDSNVK